MSKLCVKCGAQLDDDAGFCGACGAKQTPAAQAAPAVNAAAPADEAVSDTSPIGAMGKKVAGMSPEQKKKIGIIAVVAAAVIIVAIIAGVVIHELTKYQKIDCQDLYYVTYSGINGKAEAEVFLATPENIQNHADNALYNEYYESEYYEKDDYSGFFDSKASKWLVSDSKALKKAWDKFDSTKDIEKAKSKLIDNIEFKIDEEDLKDLSNGDEIKVKVKYSESKLKDRNIKLENTEFTIKVEGLVEPEVIDIWSGVKVVYEGADGYGTAELDTSGVPDFNVDYFYYYLDEYYSDLSNGDSVSVSVTAYKSLNDGYFTVDDKYYTYDENGLTKQFTVEGLKELTVVDPFENIKIEYSGIAPDLRVSVNTDDCSEAVRSCVSFELSQRSGLTVGDTFTVTAKQGSWDAERFAEEGFKLESESVEKEYTVGDDAPQYINDINKAQKIDVETIFKEIYDDINESVGSGYLCSTRVFDYSVAGEIAAIKAITVDDAYLVAPSDIPTSSNVYYQLLKVDTACTVDGASTNKTFYIAVEAEGAYVSGGELNYDDWWLTYSVSEDKASLIASTVNKAENKVQGKVTTKFGQETAAAGDPAADDATASGATAADATAGDGNNSSASDSSSQAA